MTRICMRSVQRLKDRGGSCSSSKAMFGGFKPSKAKSGSESSINSSKQEQVRWVSNSTETAKETEAAEEIRRLREAEKAEKVMHLICWGPHLI
ncbi:hypothetical protein CDL15_Pgr002780 [Punica granatum]|nr:hypothetical protein CDL15_Pgr002780 [Punica granatum]